jgi:hypothetical protein
MDRPCWVCLSLHQGRWITSDIWKHTSEERYILWSRPKSFPLSLKNVYTTIVLDIINRYLVWKGRVMGEKSILYNQDECLKEFQLDVAQGGGSFWTCGDVEWMEISSFPFLCRFVS